MATANSHHIATCPACQLAFEASDEQLKAADGLVRCGACLGVFNALANGSQPSHQAPASDTVSGPLATAQAAIDGAAGDAAIDNEQGEKLPSRGPDYAPPGSFIPPPAHLSATFDAPTESHSSLLHPALWLTLLMATGLATALFYAHSNAAALSADPRLQPALHALCQISGCKLSTAATTVQRGVVVTRLVLRNHPDQYGLLRLEALLENTATRALDFPVLTLLLEDLQGATVIRRQFTPAQYLPRQQAAGITALSAGETLRVELDLLDPGPTAVSYRLHTDSGTKALPAPRQ